MNTKTKGKMLEEHVAEQIRLKGLDPRAYRENSSGAGNREKGDIWTSLQILGQNVGIECKNQNTIKIHEWWRQAIKMVNLGREPVLVFKLFGENLGESKAVIYLDTLLELLVENKNLKEKLK